MGDYNAKFSTVTVTGDKLAGAYDYPPDPQGEVTITGSFDPKNAIGTWSLGAKGQPGGQAIAGTLESDASSNRSITAAQRPGQFDNAVCSCSESVGFKKRITPSSSEPNLRLRTSFT